MSRLIHLIRKSHNVSVLLYHAVFPARYRRVVFDDSDDSDASDDSVEGVLRSVCLDISLRYEIEFIEIGTDGDHVQGCCRAFPLTAPPTARQETTYHSFGFCSCGVGGVIVELQRREAALLKTFDEHLKAVVELVALA